MSTKRKAELEVPIQDKDDLLKIIPLGAGNEVGRSSILVQYKGKNILLDAGIHPAHNGIASLPHFDDDDVDMQAIDVLLVTHFHVDHAAAVPYVMQKTWFRGRVFMTPPTIAIFRWVMADFVRVSHGESANSGEQLFSEEDVERSCQRIESIDYHQSNEVNGIKFTAYPAGHVLGAAMFLIEVAGVKILYTGDYSTEEDRHLIPAEKPDSNVDVLITESTFGTNTHDSREEREKRFTDFVHTVVRRGGRCLLPVFAVGRAQEIQLILEEYWKRNNLTTPIYCVSSLARRSIKVYQTYIRTMNRRIQEQFANSNPFIFQHIHLLKDANQFDDTGPCVMIASPGMLQNGFSRELLERWAPDMKNGLAITGYSVAGTTADEVQKEPKSFKSLYKEGDIPLNMQVDKTSFAAHVDFLQNCAFIESIKAPYVILVHGEKNGMNRLKDRLNEKFGKLYNMSVYTPANCKAVELYFRGEKLAKVLGTLASKYPTENQTVQGVVVNKHHQLSVMTTDDLNEIENLTTTVITQRQVVAFRAGFELLRWHLETVFGAVTETHVGKDGKSGDVHLRVFDAIDVKQLPGKTNQVMLEWVGNVMNDMVADSVLAVILSIDSSPASVRMSHVPCHHAEADTTHSEFEDTVQFLREQFGTVEADDSTHCATVLVDNHAIKVDCLKFSVVESDDDTLKQRVAEVLQRVRLAIRPISDTFTHTA